MSEIAVKSSFCLIKGQLFVHFWSTSKVARATHVDDFENLNIKGEVNKVSFSFICFILLLLFFAGTLL